MSLSTPFRAALVRYIEEQARPQDKFGHQPRLYTLTRSVGAGLAYDDDVVFAAAFLHDLGVFIGHRPEKPELLERWDHVRYTVEQAPRLLGEFGFPASKIPAVLQAIEQHQPHNDPPTTEATVLRDADILEQLGAVGVLRAVAKVGRDTRYPTFSPAVSFLRRSLETLPGKIRLPTTRALAAPRIEALHMFLQAIEREAGEELF